MRNQRGQLILEAVLLMVVFFGIVSLVAVTLKKNEFVSQIVQGPWVSLAGMFQNGVWAPAIAGQPIHPTAHPRHITVQGELAR